MCDVLVLDDDPLIRMVMVDALEDGGLTVCEASCLREARTAMAKQPSCRVLMVDHDLGELDGANGFAFGHDALVASPDVAVIYVTGRWELFDGSQLTSRERRLPKPFLPGDLLRLARELLSCLS